MSTKPRLPRTAGQPKAKPIATPPSDDAPGDANPADSPAQKSPPFMKEVGGSGLMLWDNNLLFRTMQAVRPPTLREGETLAQHKTEIAGCAGIALEAFKPKDAVEAMIASQAVALHYASLECARRAMLPEQPSDVASRLRKDAANSARAMVEMTEALERRRGKGPQVVRVERVVVNEGGQAVVGHVTAGAALPTSGPAPQSIGQGARPMVALRTEPVEAGEGEDRGAEPTA